MAKNSIKEVKENLAKIMSFDELKSSGYLTDERKGVKNAIRTTVNRLKKEQELHERFIKMQLFEQNARKEGYHFIAGIDEVGRGPLAGPVVSAAVILPENFNLLGVNDSKQLSAKKRDELFEQITKQAISIGIGIKDEKVIDSVNIYEATKLAMLEAVSQLGVSPDYLLIDAMKIDSPIPQEKIIKGDAKSLSISCASIIAKVTRDKIMSDYHQLYPEYGFEKNAGYGTKEHLLGLEKFGVTPIHRRSFAPVKDMN